MTLPKALEVEEKLSALLKKIDCYATIRSDSKGKHTLIVKKIPEHS